MATKKHNSSKSKSHKTSKSKVTSITSIALKVDCPDKRCGSKKGHRCVSIHYNKGEKRNNPHRVRIQLATKKFAKAA